MNYEIFTDSSANLSADVIREMNIRVLPLPCFIGDEMQSVADEGFNINEFYDKLAEGVVAKTSLISCGTYMMNFEPVLQEGKDLIYISISSGISGTFQSALAAAGELQSMYPDRKIYVVDSLAASLGQGLLVYNIAKMRAMGRGIDAAKIWIERNRLKMCQIFTVDDLMYLKRGGRLSGATALMGTLLNIKPILKGDDKGKIVSSEKVRGKIQTINRIVKLLSEKIVNPENQIIGITHTNCYSEAKYMAEKIRERINVKDIMINVYDPSTGSHLGPGALAVFFVGNER